MSAILSFPIGQRLVHDMQRMGLAEADKVTDLHAERVKREREASERRFRERYGFDDAGPDLPGAA
jgi:hypothetical protein